MLFVCPYVYVPLLKNKDMTHDDMINDNMMMAASQTLDRMVYLYYIAMLSILPKNFPLLLLFIH